MCATTMSLFIFLSQNNLDESLEKMYKSESESIVKHTLLSFEHQLSSVEDTLEQLRQSLIVVDKYSSNTAEITALIQERQESFAINGRIIYGLENGDFFLGVDDNIPESYNPIEQEWYKLALENGVVDINTVYPQFIKKLKAAGIDKIVAVKQRQLNAWATANRIK